jgi:hypothetical protein
MIAKCLMIPRQTQQIAHPQGMSAKQVRLNGQTVAVAASHLNDGFQPLLHHNCPGANARHAHDGRLVIGDVYPIAKTSQQGGFLANHVAVSALRRPQFTGDSKMARRNTRSRVEPDR